MTTHITVQNILISKILSFDQKEKLDDYERYFVCTGSLTNYLTEIFTEDSSQRRFSLNCHSRVLIQEVMDHDSWDGLHSRIQCSLRILFSLWEFCRTFVLPYRILYHQPKKTATLIIYLKRLLQRLKNIVVEKIQSLISFYICHI